MNTRVAGEHELFCDGTVRVVGNTQASAGYLYVCAYLQRGVSREQAEQVLAAVKAQFGWYVDQGAAWPHLRDHRHESLTPGSWPIDWEEGPHEWAILVSDTHVDQHRRTEQVTADAGYMARGEGTPTGPVRNPFAGVFLKPINSFTLGLYPTD